MRIAFTGHRDRLCAVQDLERLFGEHPNAEWITGGAIGFDRQVEEFCAAHTIQNTIFKPDYERYGRSAPLKRNLQIIEGASLLVACYDGRSSGGTLFTLNAAKAKNISVLMLNPL